MPDPAPLSRMYYNPGWRDEPVQAASPDARYKPCGQHIMIDLWEGDPQFLNDIETMTEVLRVFIVDAGMHIL
jgi:S-adenosylmethionine/arginine decarboxylase-like enzyme